MTMNMEESQKDKAEKNSRLSICDVIADNSNQVIMKIESLIPTNIGNLVDLNSEYLRIAKGFFGTCYIVEREFLDKIWVDHRTIGEFDKFLRVITRTMISEIEIASNFQKILVNNTMSAMKSYEDYVKLMVSSYAKMLEYTPALIPKKV